MVGWLSLLDNRGLVHTEEIVEKLLAVLALVFIKLLYVSTMCI
jgi:hypothetical protein